MKWNQISLPSQSSRFRETKWDNFKIDVHMAGEKVALGVIKTIKINLANDIFTKANQDDTMHERPSGKIGLYTRFFDFANFRLLLSTFFVDILRHYRIKISQLSIIGAAKVFHFEILCRVYGIVPTVGLFWYFYVNSKKSGYDFSCPASFSWHTAKHVIRDHAPVAAGFNAQDYATLVAHPSLFWKFLKAFLCLVGLSRHYTLDEDTYLDMDLFAFIHALDPTKVRVVEREQEVDEPWLLDTTIGSTIPLLPVAHDRVDSELEASVERLFDKGGSGTQTEKRDSSRGGPDADIQPVVRAVNIVTEDAAPVRLRHQGKRKSMALDAGGASHPPKKLREDHGTPSETSVAGKSRSSLLMLLAEAVLNAKVGVMAIPTLPFVTASVSTTPERGDEDHTDSVAEPNLRTIRAPQRFVISADSSHHSGPTIAESEVDSLVRSPTPVMTTATTVTSIVDSTLVAKERTVKPSLFVADSSSVGGADPNTSVFSDLSGSDFLVGGIRTVIDPDTDLQKVYVPQWSVTNGSRLDDGHVCREMVDEFAPPKFFASEKRRLQSVVEKQDELLKAKDGEIENLKAQLLLKEAEAAEAIRLRAQTSNLEVVEKSIRDEVNALKGRNVILEKKRDALDVKVTDLEVLVVGKECDLTDLNAQLTSVNSQNDSLADHVHKLKVSSVELQRRSQYDPAFGGTVLPHILTTISGRRWLLTHGMELAIAKCLNSPEYLSALEAAIGKALEKAEYISALRQLQDVNFPLLVELKSNKDASVEAIMEILRLEGMEGTYEAAPATAITTALSTTLALTGTINPIFIDDYEFVDTNDQAGADGMRSPFHMLMMRN
uniref:Transposase (putative) gypsy type domain-containing protein n=1 Tax=Tanacetum cinerariifolium TaxID=118510 RepID=A0A6L2KJR7_TANCI|nr:hypothetical protein [Tanacetum cinerariifolium]